jgi:hypothetical protein
MRTSADQRTTPWIKASRSSGSGDCVELRRHAGTVEVRDSKNPDGPVLKLTSAQFSAWLNGAKGAGFGQLQS